MADGPPPPAPSFASRSESTVLRVGINGIGGRMGREIVAAAASDPGVVITGGVESPDRVAATTADLGDAILVVNTVTELLPKIDVLIDFSTPEATMDAARACAVSGTPLVSGTTGLSTAHMAELESLSKRCAIFHSRNMSVGINALIAALPSLVQVLAGYDIEVVEAHHRHKVDAPSGTAVALAEAVAAGLSISLAEHATYGREGIAPREVGEIGIHAIRAGGNAGEHTIIIANDGEEIRIGHRAYSRRTFALGALRAAHFLSGQPAGMMSMADLIGGHG